MLAERGAKVVLGARRLDLLQDIEHLITSQGGQCLAVQTDVTSESEVEHLFDEAYRQFDRVDILIHSVGRGLQATLEETGTDQWQASHLYSG